MEGGFPSRLPSLSCVSDGANANDDPNDVSNQRPPVREHDQYMPIANIIRIMRRVLPTYAKISDDAKETIQECVSEYISFITSEANERCQREHRKTVTAEDLLWAMGKLGFDDYVEPLSSYINRYRELETGRNPLKSEDYGKRKMDYDPPLGVPLYGPNFNYGPQPGMFDVMDMGQTIDGPINGPINGPFTNGDFGGQMVDPMGGPMVGAVGGYYGESSGVGDPSTHPPGPYDFNPYAQFK